MRGLIAIIPLFFLLLGANAQSSSGIRAALVQSTIAWGDMDSNVAAFEHKIRSIEGCDLIVLPELFTVGCDMSKRAKEVKVAAKRAVAERYPTVVEKMKQWAKISNAVIIGSTIYEEDSLFYNRLLAVYPDGNYHIYDKHNCFRMGSFTAGKDHLVIDIKGHRLATYICYDLRFSDWSHNDGRYDTAIYIANWSVTTSDDWSRLLSERAKENRAYVIGVNCVGKDLAGVEFIGGTALYSPNGEPSSQCKDGKEQTLVVNIPKHF